MITLSLADMAEIMRGDLQLFAGNASKLISGTVHTDSRRIVAGDIFFALPGEVTDGHNFALSAIENGAELLVVERKLDLPVDQIIVPVGLTALWDLAREVLVRVRNLGKIKVVAITGSNGKTTTKNMLQAILSEFGNTVAPEGSFNNEVGLPVSVLRIREDTDYLVAEMGASARGEIRDFTGIAPPDIGVVLKVGLAHLGEFGSIEDTRLTKQEMVQAVPESGLLILNADDPMVVSMQAEAKAPILYFSASGLAENAYAKASEVDLNLDGTSFTLKLADVPDPIRVSIRVIGEHHVNNAMVALIVAKQLGLDLIAASAALAKLDRAERWRMEKLELANGAILINDAYNASPDSTAAALKTLAELGHAGYRTVAVIGEMADLGAESIAQHERIGILVVRLNINQLYVVGSAAKALHNAAELEGSWDGESKYFETLDELYHQLLDDIKAGDLVLFKSSKSAELRFVGDKLAEVKN